MNDRPPFSPPKGDGKSLLDNALDFGTEEKPSFSPFDQARLIKVLEQIKDINDRLDRLTKQF